MKKKEKSINRFLPSTQVVSLLSGAKFTLTQEGQKTAFTLVELIVVITILAILGTIAFLSMQGYSSNARDSNRTTDIGILRTSLGIYDTKVGKYPLPTNSTGVTYSGGLAWDQGSFGTETFKQLGDINKLPKDPLTENEYTYSITSNKTEYEISGVYEGNISQNKNILKETYADGNISGISKIAGTYNGVSLSVSTGTTTYTLFTPTITTSDLITNVDLQEIITNNKLVLNGSSKLPSSYINSKFKDTTISLLIGTNNGGSILLSTGSIGELKSTTQQGKTARINFITNLQKVLSGSAISSNYTELIELDTSNTGTTNLSKIDAIAMNVVNGKWSPKINTTILSTPVANSCATQPSYTNAIFTLLTPTTVNQERQSTNSNNPCYWTCGSGKVLLGNDCVSESCSGITPDGTSKVGNATSTAGGTWHYTTTPGVCTYSCNTGYHTEDSGVTCTSDTRSCSITNGVGSQTWNSGTSEWNTCTVTSCDSGYTQSSNSCNPACAIPIPTGGNYGTTTIGTPTSPNQAWTYSSTPGNCTYSCINGYTGSNCSTAPVTNYPGCDTADITVGAYTISACNVGASVAWTGSSSDINNTYNQQNIYGHYFQWGRNKGFVYGDTSQQSTTIPGTVGLNAGTDTYGFVWKAGFPSPYSWANTDITNNWGNTTNTVIARQGPCATGYHVPSQTEWSGIVTAGGWGTNGTNMQTALKMPFAGIHHLFNGYMYFQASNGYYWSSSPNGTYGYLLYFVSSSINYGGDYRALGFSLRCFKN